MRRLYLLFSVISVWCFAVGCNGQGQEWGGNDRRAAVAGSFYPSDRAELLNDLTGYFEKAPVTRAEQPLALVVPHAGYIYSGGVAAAAYRQIDRERVFKHIFILGPIHKVYFEGAAVFPKGNFITPLGKVPVDPLGEKLSAGNRVITVDEGPHQMEHCIEVQLPFLQYWLRKPFSIVPIVVGGESQQTCRQLAEALTPYFTDENLFIISSDFSHYPTYEMARKLDKEIADAILKNDGRQFVGKVTANEQENQPQLATSMCGWMPMLSLLYITEKDKDLMFKEILYRNSGDIPSGDMKRVVGYWAISVGKKPPEQKSSALELNKEEKVALLKIARNAVTEYVRKRNIPPVEEKSLPPHLLQGCSGVFVTLKEHQNLRGCIGNFLPDRSLYQVVQSMAIASATQDSRYEPVTTSELDAIEIEISVLTPLKRIYSIDEFELGRDGLYMKKGSHTGTFLPQVAGETGWSKEEFFGHCAREKALIGWDGWKDKEVELYSYQALVFNEKEFSLKRK